MLNFAERTGCGAVIVVWSFLLTQSVGPIENISMSRSFYGTGECCREEFTTKNLLVLSASVFLAKQRDSVESATLTINSPFGDNG
jgi:hypothetical protein